MTQDFKPYGWRKPNSVPYDHEDVIRELKETLKYIEEADDHGSVDWAIAGLKDYFIDMKEILDENGSL